MGNETSKHFIDLPFGYRKTGKTQRVSIHFPYNSRENSEYVRDVHLVMMSSSIESEEEDDDDGEGKECVEAERYVPNNEENTMKNLHELGLEAVTFTQLDSMVNISLCSKGLIQLSRNIGYLSNSHYVQLCCNKLRTIPLEIGYLQHLTVLDLSNNQISVLPETIGLLTELVELKLSDNRLRYLPSSMAMLSQLSVLRLNSNCFQEVPRLVGRLTNLANLDVANNDIKYFPAEITRLPFLRRIWVDGCPLITELEKFMSPTILKPQSLLEISARSIIRSHLPICKFVPQRVLDYLKSAKSCSFCGGPFFQYSVMRARFLEKNDQTLPIVYYLCEAHWNTDSERVKLLFCQRTDNTPKLSLKSGSSSISSIKRKQIYQKQNPNMDIPQLPPLPSTPSRFSSLMTGRRLLGRATLRQSQGNSNLTNSNFTSSPASTEYIALS